MDKCRLPFVQPDGVAVTVSLDLAIGYAETEDFMPSMLQSTCNDRSFELSNGRHHGKAALPHLDSSIAVIGKVVEDVSSQCRIESNLLHIVSVAEFSYHRSYRCWA